MITATDVLSALMILAIVYIAICAFMRNASKDNVKLEKDDWGFKHEVKKGKVKKYCEVVIPFEFSINRFYRKPANYYHYRYHYHWHIHNQMRFHHQNQMMHQQIINSMPRPPSMRSGF